MTTLRLNEETAWGALWDLRQDLREHPYPEVFSSSRYDKSELLRIIDSLLTIRGMKRAKRNSN